MAEHVPDVTPEVPGTGWRLALATLGRLPQAALSRGFGALADVRVPRPLRRTILGGAARTLGMDLSDAEHAVEEYGSLNELFVRRLRPGLRPVSPDPRALCSPVDGVIGQVGRVRDGRLVQAKGRHYTAAALLADAALAERFQNGTFLTIYLSPRHYHRIHSPVAGRIVRARHVPGGLLPVNEPAVMHVAELFARNERLIACIDAEVGFTAVVAVGAYNVGRISAVFDEKWRADRWVTNRRGAVGEERRYSTPIPVEKGEEIMAFHLGSTIVLLVDAALTLLPNVVAGADVRLGTDLARSY